MEVRPIDANTLPRRNITVRFKTLTDKLRTVTEMKTVVYAEDIDNAPTLQTVPLTAYETLERRLKHLLKSDFIRSFDEHDPKTHTYKRDIAEADMCAAEPVKHGRWIVHGQPHMWRLGDFSEHWVECSECNTVGSPGWKRCPVCEAKMDLEVFVK